MVSAAIWRRDEPRLYPSDPASCRSADWFAAQGLGAAPAPARDARRGARRAAARCWSRRPARARRWPGSCRRSAELVEQPARRAAHALRLAAEGAGGRRPAQPARADRRDGPADPRRDPHRRHARPTARRGSGVTPPQILLTTPESLSLLLSYPDSRADVRESEDRRRRRDPRLRHASKRGDLLVAVAWRGLQRSRPACGASACRRPSPTPTPTAPGSRPMATSSWSISCIGDPGAEPDISILLPRGPRSPGPAIRAAMRPRR